MRVKVENLLYESVFGTTFLHSAGPHRPPCFISLFWQHTSHHSFHLFLLIVLIRTSRSGVRRVEGRVSRLEKCNICALFLGGPFLGRAYLIHEIVGELQVLFAFPHSDVTITTYAYSVANASSTKSS